MVTYGCNLKPLPSPALRLQVSAANGAVLTEVWRELTSNFRQPPVQPPLATNCDLLCLFFTSTFFLVVRYKKHSETAQSNHLEAKMNNSQMNHRALDVAARELRPLLEEGDELLNNHLAAFKQWWPSWCLVMVNPSFEWNNCQVKSA